MGGCSHLPFVQISNPGRTVIDGVKIMFLCVMMEEILSSLGISIYERKIDGTGILKWSKAKHEHLTFILYPAGRVIIEGSLHKYWKGNNSSDFSFVELCECISDICQRFHIPLNAKLQNVEAAVNISTLCNPFDFCNNVIAYLDGKKPFKDMDEGEPVIGFECERTEYTVKIYDKGLQCGKHNILRFELSANKMRAVQAASIKTLSDLTERTKIEMLGVILNETFSDLIISDNVNPADLSQRELQIYNRGINPKEWGKMPRWERTRFKKQFRRIIETYGRKQWIAPIAKMIDEKWKELLGTNSQNANVLSDLLSESEKKDCKRSPHFVKEGERSTLDFPQRFCIAKVFGKRTNRYRNKDPPKSFLNSE